MTRPTVTAYRRSGFVPLPPSRAVAEAAYGVPLPDPVWAAIDAAFLEYGDALNVLAGLRLNENPNDPASHDRRLARHKRGLLAAFAAVTKLRGDADTAAAMAYAAADANARARAALLAAVEADDDDAMARWTGHVESGRAACTSRVELYQELDAAAAALLRLVATASLVAAQPPATTFSETDARRRLTRAVVAALDDAGLNTRLTGWREDEPDDRLTKADLTPTERLLVALGISPSTNATTAARWIRGATQRP